MTEVYEKFIAQYNSIGSQKADGYDESFFWGMTEIEKENSFEMLKNEAIAPGVAEWMFYLNTEKAKLFFMDYIDTVDSDRKSGMHRVYAQLYKQTKNDKYFDLLVSNFHFYPERDKREVVWSVHGLKPGKEKETSFYLDVISRSGAINAVSAAADFLLRLNGYAFNTEEEKNEFYRIRELLKSNDKDVKFRAIEKFVHSS